MKASNQITSKRRLARKWALVAGFLLASLAPKESRGESETVSREVSVFNFGRPSADVEAISREVSVFNFGQPSAAIEAISREVSVFNFGRPSAEVEAISREVSVLNIEGLTNQPPVIFVQPQSQSVAFGSPVTLSVTAGGTAPLSYQWFFNATNVLAGATGSVLAISNVNLENFGTYHVVVSNGYGTATSVPALLVENCGLAPAGLVAWWTAEGNANDSLGQNHGLLRNGATTVQGKVGQAFSLDGSDDMVDIGGLPQLDGANELTVMAWIYREDLSNPYSGIVGKYGYGTSSDSFLLYTGEGFYENLGKFLVEFDGGGWAEATGTNPIPAGQWMHVAGTWRSSDGRIALYKNGVAEKVNIGATGRRMVSNPLNIAKIGEWGPGYLPSSYKFHGKIDEVTIFNRALGSNEIAATFAAGSAGMCTSSVPVIATQPLSQIVAAGTNVTMSVVASGLPALQYQWFFNGSLIGGANAASLALLNVDAARTGGYRVMVSNALGGVMSDVATLIVNELPLITQQPQSQTALTGQSASFSVNATGSLPLGFFWYRNGLSFTNMVLNEHSSTISLANVQTFDSANLQVVVNNAANMVGVASSVATLTVVAPVAVTQQPTNVAAGVGGSATFCVEATGSAPIRYQWRHNGASISNATNACLSIANVQLADGGAYQVVLENAVGTLASDPALLVIAAPTGPAPDHFTNRFALSGASGSIGVTNVGATKEPGEPNHAAKPGGASVWYRWTAPATGIATFRTLGSTFDTLLAIYTGTNVANLTGVTSDEDDGGFFTSLVQFNAVLGVEYQIALDGFGGAEGSFILSWSLESTAEVLPGISQQPASRSVPLGTSTTLTVGASGNGLRYQWHFLGAALVHQTNSTLNLPGVQAVNVGNYFAAVTNNLGRGLHSDVAVVEIGPVPTVQSQDKFQDLFLDGSGGDGFALASSGGGFISVSIGTTTVPQILNNSGSKTQAGEMDSCGAVANATRVLRYRVENAGVLVLDTLGSAIATVLRVYEGVDGLGFPTGLLACGVTNAADTRASLVRIATSAGREYVVVFDGYRGAEGIIQLNARLGQAPTLPAANPTNAVVDAGDGIELTAPEPVNGSSGLHYQWRLNGGDIPGATGATYQLGAADSASGGSYTVVVYNDYGQALYPVATVAVQLSYLRGDPQLLNGQLRLWVQRPANGAVLVEGAGELGLWSPLHTVPLTAPGPALDLPLTNTHRFFRARPWP